MHDKPRQLERFFWLLIRVGATVFAWLMLFGGGLFALAFLMERLRTGAVSYGGAERTDLTSLAWAVGLPAGIAAGGALGVLLLKRYERARQADAA